MVIRNLFLNADRSTGVEEAIKIDCAPATEAASTEPTAAATAAETTTRPAKQAPATRPQQDRTPGNKDPLQTIETFLACR
jgi:hypothetical protein